MARDYDALLRFFAERSVMPFEWGTNDCARFAGGAVKALTGKDPLKGLNWTSQLGAARVLKKGGGLAKIVSQRLREVPISMAKRGDVAAVADAQHGIFLMIVEVDTLVGPGEFGSTKLRRSAMVRAWSAD